MYYFCIIIVSTNMPCKIYFKSRKNNKRKEKKIQSPTFSSAFVQHNLARLILGQRMNGKRKKGNEIYSVTKWSLSNLKEEENPLFFAHYFEFLCSFCGFGIELNDFVGSAFLLFTQNWLTICLNWQFWIIWKFSTVDLNLKF